MLPQKPLFFFFFLKGQWRRGTGGPKNKGNITKKRSNGLASCGIHLWLFVVGTFAFWCHIPLFRWKVFRFLLFCRFKPTLMSSCVCVCEWVCGSVCGFWIWQKKSNLLAFFWNFFLSPKVEKQFPENSLRLLFRKVFVEILTDFK